MKIQADSLAQFFRGEGGNFAVLGALVAVPLLLTMGGAVDLSIMYSNRVQVQNAADAAALAAAKRYSVDPDPGHLALYAKNFFDGNISGLSRSTANLVYEGVSFNADHSRQLKLHAEYTYSPMFLPLNVVSAQIFGGKVIKVASTVQVSDTTVEVAMVLDTSGSMASSPSAGGESKIVTLRRVARAAAAKFFSGSTAGSDDPARVAVVPFSGAVNLGVANLDAWWMDPEGLSPIHHENFDWTTLTDAGGNRLATKSTSNNSWYLTASPATALTRQYVVKNMKTPTMVKDLAACKYKGTAYSGCTWTGTDGSWVMKKSSQICSQATDPTGCHPYRVTYAANPMFALSGCVEARGGVYGVTDDAPSESNPATLFLPYMAVDEPDSSGYNDFLADDAFQFPKGVYPLDGKSFFAQQRNMNKYLLFPTRTESREGDNHRYSPNHICDSAPVMPLSTNAAAVDTMIGGLQAVGATNVDEGIGWGWRALSPGEPFTGSRAYSDPKNIKAIILMTDGENTSYVSGNDDKSWFSSYGFAQVPVYNTKNEQTGTKAGRIFEQSGQSVSYTNSAFTLAMDGRTKKVCANAKADGKSVMTNVNGAQLTDERGPVVKDGIIIYTIAFDIPAASATRVDALLKDCASYKTEDLRNTALTYAKKAKNFYSAKNAAELDEAFAAIAASLSRLRVAR